MSRKVFFSFHYDDVTRANEVRNSDKIKRKYQEGVGFEDKSLWEKAKKQGSTTLKRMINEGLYGSSVTCVLIGRFTWLRPWVRYEILQSLARGNGILGINIHDAGFPIPGKPDSKKPGPNPLRYLGYRIDRQRGKISFLEWESNVWKEHPHVQAVSLSSLQWMSNLKDTGCLDSLFQVHGWTRNQGHSNFPTWVEEAAQQVGR